MARSAAPALLLGCTLALFGARGAHAELPPWVYGEQQRQAPVVVDLAVGRSETVAGERRLRCRLLKVIRQPPTGQLKPGQLLGLRYLLPSMGAPPMVGPAPMPVLKTGDKVTAWLKPIAGEIGTFAPAAGGRSFGPPMEDAIEPGTPQ